MWLVYLSYYFECDWLTELSDNKLSNNKMSDDKLSDDNLASELGENRTFLNQSRNNRGTIEKIVNFVINIVIILYRAHFSEDCKCYD